jgi:hypothetical protein
VGKELKKVRHNVQAEASMQINEITGKGRQNKRQYERKKERTQSWVEMKRKKLVKVKLHGVKAYGERGGTGPTILTLGTKRS